MLTDSTVAYIPAEPARAAPAKRTRGATKTRMAGHEGPGLHYKHVRTTIALFCASTLFAQLDEETRAQFRAIVDRNYDLSGVPDETLTATIATLDDDLMKKVRDEYEFVPRMGNIRDHGACVAHCALCGKGNSKAGDGEENRDKLRYDFRLQNNNAGGADLYVGADCIVNFALKVKGAETSAEARAILERSLREHLALWRQEAWRAANPSHATIPELWQAYVGAAHEWRYWSRFGSREADIHTLGQSQRGIYFALTKHTRVMKALVRFYERKNFLTEAKTEEWKQARAFMRSLSWLRGALLATEHLQGHERHEALVKALDARKRALATISRTPRRL